MPITHEPPLHLRARYLRHVGWVIFATLILQGLILYGVLPGGTGIAARTVQSFSDPFTRTSTWVLALGGLAISFFPVDFTQLTRWMFFLASCYLAVLGAIAEYYLAMTRGVLALAWRLAHSRTRAAAVALLLTVARACPQPGR